MLRSHRAADTGTGELCDRMDVNSPSNVETVNFLYVSMAQLTTAALWTEMDKKCYNDLHL